MALHYTDDFMQDALNEISQFNNELMNAKNKIHRFNIREEESRSIK